MNQAQFIAEATPIIDAVNDQFTKIFGIDSRAAIEDATVYAERILDTGRKFTTRYFGKNKELVINRAQKEIDSIDPYRSPSQTSVRQYQIGYQVYSAIDVTYWGL